MSRPFVSFDDSQDAETSLFNVISKIKENSKKLVPSLIVFTASSDEFSNVASRFNKEFPDSLSIGMSSYVNFSSEGYSLKAVSAIALYEDIECVGGVIDEIIAFPKKYVDDIRNRVGELGVLENTICLEFTTAFSNCEDLVQDTFREALAVFGIPTAGGSAGCVLGSRESYVALNGVVYSEACVYALIHNKKGAIHMFKENMFKPTDHFYMATDVDCDDRLVYEFDHMSAAQAVSQALGVSIDELSEQIKMHPVGRVEGDEILITDVDEVLPSGAISYFARIFNLSRLVQLEAEDIDLVWDLTARNVHNTMKNISFSLAVNCFSRSQYFIGQNRFGDFNHQLTKEYGEFIGFSGYGEQMNYEHLNQTLVLVCFE